jgi:Mn-dependent DtxR family transcriptional regulator
MKPEDKPIGYWLKHLDRLIEDRFDATLAATGLARRHWQLLNTLHAGPASVAGLTESLRPFWTEGDLTVDEVVAELAGRGWISMADDGRWALTPEGVAGHAEIRAKVHAARRAITDGISADEYVRTVGTLRRMAENLS